MLLCDRQIEELSINQGLISPFSKNLIREFIVNGNPNMPPGILKCLSFGLSSFGYDLRLSPKSFKVFKHLPGRVVNPKQFNSNNLEELQLFKDKYGSFFIFPAHSYGLGIIVESLRVPKNISGICFGKSTYARCGIAVNMTPVEAGFQGNLTVGVMNGSSADVRIFAGEGIAQILFLEGIECSVSYDDRQGKYQNQSECITIAKI